MCNTSGCLVKLPILEGDQDLAGWPRLSVALRDPGYWAAGSLALSRCTTEAAYPTPGGLVAPYHLVHIGRRARYGGLMTPCISYGGGQGAAGRRCGMDPVGRCAPAHAEVPAAAGEEG